MGIFSSDKKTTTNTTNYVTNTQIGLEEIEGPAILGSNNVIMQSDAGAISAGEGIARESLKVSADSHRSAFEFGDRVAGYALDVVNESGSRIAAGFNDALKFADNVSERERSVLASSFDFSKDLFGSSLEAVTGVLQEGQAQLGNTVSNLNTIARQQSTSSDERIQQIAGTAIKAAAVVAGLFVVGFIFTRFAR